MGEELLVVKSSQDLEKLKKENPGKEIVSYLIPAAVIDCGDYDLLVELVKGGVVVDIDSSYIVNFVSLEELSMNEISVLEQGIKLGSFTANDIKLDMNHFRVESLLMDLVRKELLTVDDKRYKVGHRFRLIYHPEDYAIDVIPETIEVEGIKLEAKSKIYEVKDRINRIAKVNNLKECWILYHKAK